MPPTPWVWPLVHADQAVVGAGNSDLSAYDPQQYGTLDGYAAEVTEVLLQGRPGHPEAFRAATFLSDNRADLPRGKVLTLVLQCSDDVIAPD